MSTSKDIVSIAHNNNEPTITISDSDSNMSGSEDSDEESIPKVTYYLNLPNYDPSIWTGENSLRWIKHVISHSSEPICLGNSNHLKKMDTMKKFAENHSLKDFITVTQNNKGMVINDASQHHILEEYNRWIRYYKKINNNNQDTIENTERKNINQHILFQQEQPVFPSAISNSPSTLLSPISSNTTSESRLISPINNSILNMPSPYSAASHQLMQPLLVKSTTAGYERRSHDTQAGLLLWQFMLKLLLENQQHLVMWIFRSSENEGLFRLVNNAAVAHAWGISKGNPNMSYEKMSRSLRVYYRGEGGGIIQKAKNLQRIKNKAKFTYKFNFDHPKVQLFMARHFPQHELTQFILSKARSSHFINQHSVIDLSDD